jgi:hypothetical protein
MPTHGNCYRCSTLTTGYHSGSYECGSCWNYRKLDRPAALHWHKTLLPLFSNIDFYDQTEYFPAAAAKGNDMLTEAIHICLYSKLLLEHGPEKLWSDALRDELFTTDPYEYLQLHLTDSELDLIRKAA